MCMQWVVVEYCNVKFYLVLEREEDISKFWYLNNRIEAGQKLYMRNMPITANIWNYYSYLRAKGEYKRLKRKYTEGICFNTNKRLQ